jgi:UDP-3-O-[3-hydroxymyristoyl] glucosamine N-acyltransferase
MGLIATPFEGVPALSFLEKDKFLGEMLANKDIKCVVTNEAIAPKAVEAGLGVVISASPRFAFFSLHNSFVERGGFYTDGKSPNRISASARIHPRAVIGDWGVTIGEDSVIDAGVVIFPDVTIGNRVRIGANSVVGGEGFECFRHDGRSVPVRHGGTVVIEDDVEIHCCTCIDRGLFANATIVGEGSMIDNLIHVAHNVVLGKRVFIAAGAVVAGRDIVGDDVWIGPSAVTRNGIRIKKGSAVSMGAVVTRDVEEGQTVTGNFAMEHSEFIARLKASAGATSVKD